MAFRVPNVLGCSRNGPRSRGLGITERMRAFRKVSFNVQSASTFSYVVNSFMLRWADGTLYNTVNYICDIFHGCPVHEGKIRTLVRVIVAR